jgi:hypothetical protein
VAATDDLRRIFAQNKYVVVPSLLAEPLLSSVYRYGRKRAEMAPTEWHTANEDAEAPPSPEAYADPMMDMLLANLAPHVEQITGLRVYPTFSFYRVYKRGDLLAKHKDRPACELALTLHAGCDPDVVTPLWIQGPNGAEPESLQRRDGVLYRGIDCPHWREAFHGDHALQIFLFYVDQQGPHAEWKFDKRERLSSFLRPR